MRLATLLLIFSNEAIDYAMVFEKEKFVFYSRESYVVRLQVVRNDCGILRCNLRYYCGSREQTACR